MAIQISEKAKRELAKLDVRGDNFLRISTVAGGCQGMTYSASIDDEQSDADLVLFEDGELRVITDADSVEYIDGLQIDYSDDLISAGFRFKNQRAARSCGCGSSFAV